MLVLVLALLSAAPRVASPEWAVVDVRTELAHFYADTFAQSLRNHGLDVITAQDMSTLLGVERQRQLLGCGADTSCMTELANALGCDATLTVSLARFPDGYHALLKLLSSRDGRVLSAVKLSAANDRALLAELEGAAPTLASPLVHQKEQVPAAQPLRPWWLPAGVGGLGVAGGLVLFVLSAGQYALLKQQTTLAQAQPIAQNGLGLQTGAWVATSVGAAALVAGLIWAFLPAAPVAMSLQPNGGLALTGAW